MHDLGLNLDALRPLKTVPNALGGGATSAEGVQEFQTALENSVHSDFSESEDKSESKGQNNFQPTAQMSFKQESNYTVTPEAINTDYVDTIPDAEKNAVDAIWDLEKSSLVNEALLLSKTKKPTVIGNKTHELHLEPESKGDAPSGGKVSDIDQPAELSEVFSDVTVELLEAPISAPHILDLASPVLSSKINLDETTVVGAVAKQAILPIVMETDPDINLPLNSTTPLHPDVSQNSQAQQRLAPDLKEQLSDSPVTKNVDEVKSYAKPLESLTNTNALKWLNLQSVEVPIEKSLISTINRVVIDSDSDIKNNVIIPEVLSSNKTSKKPLNSGPQVFSLQINPETEDNQGQVRADLKIQKNAAPKIELQQSAAVFARTETQPQTPPPINTSASVVDLNTTQISATPSPQTIGERFPTRQATMILNMRDTQWGQRLVSQIEKLSSTGEGKIEISLRPKNLGDMHISLEFKGQDTEVRIVTETSAASRLLIGAEDRLSQMLDAAGFKLSNFSSSSDSGFGQGLGQPTKQKQHSAPRSNENQEEGAGATASRSGERYNGTVNVIA